MNDQRNPTELQAAGYKWVVCTGNPADGFTYYGPFDKYLQALDAGEDACDGDWWVLPLAPREELKN